MPDQPFMSVARQMNKLMDQFQKNYYNFCNSETWTPNVNLYENDQAYLLCVDLAGVEKDKIDVEVHEQRLTLRGTRHVPTHPGYFAESSPKLRVHVMEIDHGAFCRMVDLPHDIERDRISAQYENGMLWIELPKK
jgi:HSP20 family protein